MQWVKICVGGQPNSSPPRKELAMPTSPGDECEQALDPFLILILEVRREGPRNPNVKRASRINSNDQAK